MAISSVLGSSALLPAGLGFRNLIINGDMRINQRNATVTANGYTVDRWKLVISSNFAAVSVASNTDVPTGQGFTSSLRMTTTAGAAASGYIYLGQLVEGFNSAQLAWGTAGAKPATISFWVRSSVAGVHTVTVVNGSETYFRPCLYTINAADTWEKKTVSVVGTTTGTWATGNTSGLRLYFFTSIGSGGALSVADEWSTSSYGISGTVNDNATTGNIFAITGVQLEQNYQPTPFEQRPYGVELALCQRYYRVQGQTSGTGSYAYFATGWSNTGTEAAFGLTIQPAMRSAPSVGTSAANTFYIDRAPAGGGATSGTVQAVRSDSLRINFANAGTATVGSAVMLLQNVSAAAFITFDAEL